MSDTIGKLTFECHHCGKEFTQQVKIIDIVDNNAAIVYEITTCPHCGKGCQLELRANEVLKTTPTYRDGKVVISKQVLAELEHLIFPTKPVKE